MRHTIVISLLLLSVPTLAQPQSPSFDMSRERPAGTPNPAPVAPRAPVNPSPARPSAAPEAVRPQVTVPASTQTAPPDVGNASTAVPAAATSTADALLSRRRYVLPFGNLSLSGEMDQRQWTLYLTPEQAQAAVSFNLTYQNSVVVAPEASSLSVRINNTALPESRIASSDSENTVSLPIPAGALQAGANIITLAANQHHRTDCTIQSTYDLWTEIEPSGTYIAFNADVGSRLTNIDDIQATGLDGAGMTAIDVVVPGLGNPAFADQLLRLSQALALRTQMPNQHIAFHTAIPAERAPGTLTVFVGTAREIAVLLPTVPAEAMAGPYAAFDAEMPGGVSPLIISGPTPQTVAAAIDSLTVSLDRPAGTVRSTLSTKTWHVPDAPLIFGDRRIPLSELGIQTSEFAGRRFRTQFLVGVPSDFYASAYGEAVLLLDAAYSAEVVPGSHIDVYVNGDIASTVPISTNGGGIFRHLPINVTMRHFVPGVNTITIEAVLTTDADTACLPGAAANAAPRFALFDTSEFHMPDFARIGLKPNLSAMSGLGQPYRAQEQPVAISLDRVDTDTMSAAATLMGRLAVAAGHPIAVETVASPLVVGDRDAIFVGSISQMPLSLISQFNIAATSQLAWKGGQSAAQPVEQTEVLFEDWRRKVNSGSWQGQISSFEEWLKRNFDITADTLRFIPGSEQSYTPPESASFMLAQGLSPSGEGVWTMATAPTSTALREGMAAMVDSDRWRSMSGRVAVYDSSEDKVETIVAEQQQLTVTQPFSFWNWRLIAANWLSTNILSYVLLFIGSLAVLGVVTVAVLRSLGRHR